MFFFRCAEETRNTLEFADDIRLMRTLGFSSKSTSSIQMKKLKETKAELLQQVNQIEEALIKSIEYSVNQKEDNDDGTNIQEVGVNLIINNY